MLDELVDHGEDKAVDGGLSGQARPRRQGEQDARGQNEEEESSRQKIPHLFAFYCGKFPRLRLRRLFPRRRRRVFRLPPLTVSMTSKI